MTAQEAINAIQIKEMQTECKATRMCEFCEGLAMAEEALEKQIPKKPKESILGVYCSQCKHFLDGTEYHCQFCGQKLDWSEDDEQ